MDDSVDRTYADVYYVETDDTDMEVDPLAIRPHVRGDRVEWETTSPGRWGMAVSVRSIDFEPPNLDMQTPPTSIRLETPDGKKYTLTRVSLPLYNEKIRHQLSGQPAFNSTEDLKAYFLETNFQSY